MKLKMKIFVLNHNSKCKLKYKSQYNQRDDALTRRSVTERLLKSFASFLLSTTEKDSLKDKEHQKYGILKDRDRNSDKKSKSKYIKVDKENMTGKKRVRFADENIDQRKYGSSNVREVQDGTTEKETLEKSSGP